MLSFSAAIVAADIPEDRDLEIAGGLEKLLGVPALETTLRIEAARKSKDPFEPVIIKDGLDQTAAFHLREQLPELPGVQVVVDPVRRYLAGRATTCSAHRPRRRGTTRYDAELLSLSDRWQSWGRSGVRHYCRQCRTQGDR